MPKVFISYRREDSQADTGRLLELLNQRLPAAEFFRDIDSIPAGTDFRTAVDQALARCDAVLVVIGPRWLSSPDAQGKRRLDSPEDFVRVEVETALKRTVPVIPVLVSNAAMPQAAELPESLRPLAFRNARKVRPDPDFHSDAELLAKDLPGEAAARKAWAKLLAPLLAVLAALGGWAWMQRDVLRLRLSCAQGSGAACNDLGLRYAKGEGVAKDAAKAISLYEAACDKGDGLACANLGVNYAKGDGVPEDLAHAAELDRKACALSEKNGCTNLGVAYDNGSGVEKDEPRALGLFKKSCELGDGLACADAGLMLVDGRGATADSAAGTALIKKGCDMGEEPACEDLRRLTKQPLIP